MVATVGLPLLLKSSIMTWAGVETQSTVPVRLSKAM